MKANSKKARSAPYKNESHLQTLIIKNYRELFPRMRYRLWAIPNGGFRFISTAKKLKAEGALSGVWDLFFSVPIGEFGGLFIECKYGYNKLTDEQIIFREQNPEYQYVVVWTVGEAIDAIQKYFAK